MKKRNEGEKGEAYFTTGELSILLGGIISRSTVCRLFDQGELGGRVNPLTGRREIEWGSVLDWLKGKGVGKEKIALVEKSRGVKWKRLEKNKSEEEK